MVVVCREEKDVGQDEKEWKEKKKDIKNMAVERKIRNLLDVLKFGEWSQPGISKLEGKLTICEN